jgi:putative DNA primase/helicase
VTSLEAALAYASQRGWPVFPCDRHKRPLVEHGLSEALRDPAQITAWWRRWPLALIGVPTGRPDGSVVLDVDVKRADQNGFDTLADLGHAILPDTPLAHTPSGGLHIYFRTPAEEMRNTAGDKGRGIGRGLDWRGQGGYVCVPSPGSGYLWDPCCGIDMPLAEVPEALLPREPEAPSPAMAQPRIQVELGRYAEAALDGAVKRIFHAGAGIQESTLNAEAYSLGRLAGGNVLPAGLALESLLCAAHAMPSFDSRRPWRATEIDRKVRTAFTDGLRKPRQVADGRR